MSSLPSYYRPGSLIANRYEVANGPLVGGMGVVYLCIDHENDQPVALKTFKPEYLSNRSARGCFLQEGTAWVSLNKHPHIVQCYEVERVGDGSEVYLVLELVSKPDDRTNASLRSWLTTGQRLSMDQALLFSLQIIRGMQHACTILPGFIHRDLKPENLLVGADTLPGWNVNRLRITDFGLAGLLKGQDSSLQEKTADASSIDLRHHTTLINGIVGTPPYMAPEQWAGQVFCPQTDVFALGCIFGEMLTGEHIVPGNTWKELEQNGSQGLIKPFPKGFPVALSDFLNRCLAREPLARFTSWNEMAAMLEAIYVQAAGQSPPAPIEAIKLESIERARKGWAYSSLGAAYLDIGRADTALMYFERASSIGQAEPEQRLEATGLMHAGLAYAHMGKTQQAISCYQRASPIMREAGDQQGEGTVLTNLSSALIAVSDFHQAFIYIEQALAIHQNIGDQQGICSDLANLGVVYRYKGDARRAVRCFEQALVIRREIRDQQGEGNDLSNLGNTYLLLGDNQRAVRYLKQALAIRQQIGDRRGEGNDLANLGNAFLALNDTRLAVKYLEQAATITREIGDRRAEGIVLSSLGRAYKDLSSHHRSKEYYEQALAIHRETGNRQGEGAVLSNIGSDYMSSGEYHRAIEFLKRALEIACDVGDQQVEEASLCNLGLAYGAIGDALRSIEYNERALGILGLNGDLDRQSKAKESLGVAHMMLGNYQRAIEYFEQALAVRRATGHLYGEGNILASMGMSYSRLGSTRLAVQYLKQALSKGMDERDASIVRKMLKTLT